MPLYSNTYIPYMAYKIPKHCDTPMKRIYFGKDEKNQKGNRVRKYIPFGWICPDCGAIEITENIREWF